MRRRRANDLTDKQIKAVENWLSTDRSLHEIAILYQITVNQLSYFVRKYRQIQAKKNKKEE